MEVRTARLTTLFAVVLPVALLYQRLPLLLAGILLTFIGLVEDLLGRRPPFEAVTSHFLTEGFAADLIGLAHTSTGRVELWVEKRWILTAFVGHTGGRTMCCLVEF